MTLAEELLEKHGMEWERSRGGIKDAINEAIERCAEVAESGGVNVADPETASRIRKLKG